MKKKGLVILFVVAMVIQMSALQAFAATKSDSWGYSSYSHGYYVPTSGQMKVSTYNSSTTGKARIKTHVTMNFTDKNVARIKLYNAGSTKPEVHAACRGIKTYLTCDVTSKRNHLQDMVHATSVTSNLPNPKYDIENDNPLSGSGTTGDPNNEESETVALGAITAEAYYMTTYWDDKRAGGSYGSGAFHCQFGMSKKGIFSDYNTVIISDVLQALVNYSGTKGSL